MSVIVERSPAERALDVLRRNGNPFRNYFARNPDDEVCARYHVPELFARERELLLGVVDLYRYDPMTHSEVVPVLGNKGAGKTHLLHSIKHGPHSEGGHWQLLVTPGVYQKDTEFLEYLLFQIIDTLLGGGKQKGIRPLEYIGEQLVRRLLSRALSDLTPAERLELFPAGGLGRWTRKLGLGQTQAQERVQWLLDSLAGRGSVGSSLLAVRRIITEAGLNPEAALEMVNAYIEKTEAHNTAGLMRRSLYQGFARAVLLGDESELASFVTFGFAELEFHVRPTRQDLVLALFKVLMEVFRTLKTPVVVAFDQLEDLLLARRSDDAHRTAEAFFAGIVQVIHQIDGLCFLIFAERGLWNRFVPSLDGYIQDRLNNPVHVPRHGTIKALRLEAPPPELVRRVVEARLRPTLEELPDFEELSSIYPFTEEQVLRIARTEPTLRDMLQQFRHLFDHIVFGPDQDFTSPISRHTDPRGESRSEQRGESAATARTDEPTTPAVFVPSVASILGLTDDAPTPDDTASATVQPQALPPVFSVSKPAPMSAINANANANATDPSATPPASAVSSASPTTPADASRLSDLMGHNVASVLVKSIDTITADASTPSTLSTPNANGDAAAAYTATDADAATADASSINQIGDTLRTIPLEAPLELDEPEAILPPAPPPLPPRPLTPPAGTMTTNPRITAQVAPLTLSPTPPQPQPPQPQPLSTASPMPAHPVSSKFTDTTARELWEQEQRAARRKLEPEGALTGATRELQAALGSFLQVCHEHGVKVGPWRLQHVVPEWTFGDHPTYGAISIAHWACKDGQPWKVGIGLFLGRGAGKPRDLEVKLAAMDQAPAVIDHLILLRPEDDLTLSGKSKALWQESERKGRHARIEALSLETFAMLYSFPRWLATLTDSLSEGTPLPNLADLIQDRAERLLEQVCMPVNQ